MHSSPENSPYTEVEMYSSIKILPARYDRGTSPADLRHRLFGGFFLHDGEDGATVHDQAGCSAVILKLDLKRT